MAAGDWVSFSLENDTKYDGPYGWIQWKGTDVCIDLYCKCGHQGHYDGEFLYLYECPSCKQRYALGQNVKLIELPDDIAREQGDFFKTDANVVDGKSQKEPY